MPTTPDLGIPELSQSQANPDITHNEALVVIQALLNGVVDRGTNAPPGSPTEGDAYVLGAAPTGAWSGRANAIAIYWGGSWRFVPGYDDDGAVIAMGARQEGLRVWVRDEDKMYTWSGSAWAATINNAGDITNTPAGNIAATTVQAAINELDTEKVDLTGDTMTGKLVIDYGSSNDPFLIRTNTFCIADMYSYGTGVNALLRSNRARGTFASPTAVADGDSLVEVQSRAYHGSGFSSNVASFNFAVRETTPTSTAMGTRWNLVLAPQGSVTPTTLFRADHTIGLQMLGNALIDIDRVFRLRGYTVATLPANTAGKIAHVTDSNAALTAGIGAVVAGGGANIVPVFNDGTNWRIG